MCDRRLGAREGDYPKQMGSGRDPHCWQEKASQALLSHQLHPSAGTARPKLTTASQTFWPNLDFLTPHRRKKPKKTPDTKKTICFKVLDLAKWTPSFSALQLSEPSLHTFKSTAFTYRWPRVLPSSLTHCSPHSLGIISLLRQEHDALML